MYVGVLLCTWLPRPASDSLGWPTDGFELRGLEPRCSGRAVSARFRATAPAPTRLSNPRDFLRSSLPIFSGGFTTLYFFHLCLIHLKYMDLAVDVLSCIPSGYLADSANQVSQTKQKTETGSASQRLFPMHVPMIKRDWCQSVKGLWGFQTAILLASTFLSLSPKD